MRLLKGWVLVDGKEIEYEYPNYDTIQEAINKHGIEAIREILNQHFKLIAKQTTYALKRKAR